MTPKYFCARSIEFPIWLNGRLFTGCHNDFAFSFFFVILLSLLFLPFALLLLFDLVFFQLNSLSCRFFPYILNSIPCLSNQMKCNHTIFFYIRILFGCCCYFRPIPISSPIHHSRREQNKKRYELRTKFRFPLLCLFKSLTSDSNWLALVVCEYAAN